MAFVENQKHYEIMKDGKRTYAGFKPEPKGIVIGEDEALAGVTFDSLKQVVVIERIDFKFDTDKEIKR
ncbi:hypothetical protein EOM86_13915 [Candidatus Nomurabacteria bacterium]|nr:hypothetical protein [Candidatus Nomurabacteria bacterium]